MTKMATSIRVGDGPEIPFDPETPSPEAQNAVRGAIDKALGIERGTKGISMVSGHAYPTDLVDEVIDKRLGRAGHLKDTPEERERINRLVAAQTDPLPGDEIRSFIERAEALEAQIKDLRDETKEVFAEAKGRGYDTKILRKIIALRKRDKDDLAEEEAILDLYKRALGMA
jgi:uncharacterized protein (UPF0335 family)